MNISYLKIQGSLPVYLKRPSFACLQNDYENHLQTLHTYKSQNTQHPLKNQNMYVHILILRLFRFIKSFCLI